MLSRPVSKKQQFHSLKDLQYLQHDNLCTYLHSTSPFLAKIHMIVNTTLTTASLGSLLYYVVSNCGSLQRQGKIREHVCFFPTIEQTAHPKPQP